MITRRHRFSHRATEVALVMHALHMTSDAAVLAVLAKINRRHPSLMFHDFWGAAVLAQAMAIKPEGHA
jgi:hypothetical protein